jgi:hypothetical protein
MKAYRLALFAAEIPQQRGRTLREDGTLYHTDLEVAQLDITNYGGALNHLLQDIPLPAL